jgi:hypothetical protein
MYKSLANRLNLRFMSGLCKLGQVVDGTTDDPQIVCIPELTEEEVQFLNYKIVKRKFKMLFASIFFLKNGLKKFQKKL